MVSPHPPIYRLRDRVYGSRARGRRSGPDETALFGMAHSFDQLLLTRIGVGLGEASLLPAGMSWLRDRMRPDQMGRAVAIFLMGASAGAIIANLVGGSLLSDFARYGTIDFPSFGPVAAWRALFLLACPPGLLVAAAVWTMPAPTSPDATHRIRRQVSLAAVHLWNARRAYGWLTLATACSVTLSQAPAAWLALYYVRSFHVPPGESAMAVGLMFVASVPLGQWTGGFLIDHLRRRGVAAAPNLVLTLSLALSVLPAAIFCTTHLLKVSFAAYVVFSLFVSVATPCGLAGWQSLTPPSSVGLVIALLVSIVTLIGVGIGLPVIGILTDWVFADQKALGSAMLILCATAGVAGSACALVGLRHSGTLAVATI